ncbi:MAG: AAA family ATPase [Bryobacter sp.]|nr:AAA family ATPase [Bryobacter sp.]
MNQTDPFQALNNWKLLWTCPSPGVNKAFQALMQSTAPQAHILELSVYPPAPALLEILGSQLPDVCLVDLVSDPEQGLQVIREISNINPKMLTVAVIEGQDTDLILRSLRAGASEFLTHPFQTDGWAQCASRLVSKNPNARGRGKAGKVAAVVPAKGACGASTVATGLVFHWKQKNSKTLLCDLDPLTGTVSFLLKLKSQFCFVDALSRSQELDEDLWKNLVTRSNGVDVMLAPEGAMEGLHDLMDASGIVDFARWNYDHAVLDVANPYGPWNLSILRHSDIILLVSTNELPSLQATQRVLNYLDQNRIDREKVKLVVNRYNRDVGLSKEVIETAIRIPVFQLLPSDFEGVQRAMIDGKPIPAGSPFGKGLMQLAEKLGGKPAEAAPKSSSWSLKSLFSR